MKKTVFNKILFCSSCHRRVLSPFSGNLKVSGNIKIQCPHCKKGKVIIKGKEAPKAEPKKEKKIQPKKKARKFTYQPDQKVLTSSGYKDISEIKKGSFVIGVGGKKHKVKSVEKVKRNFLIFNEHLHFADHQTLLVNGKWKHAKDVKVGHWLKERSGKEIKVVSIQKKQGQYDFYRLEVSPDHTYFIDGILVHNASRYWVGGTGNWDASTTTHWGSASGLADNASVPSASDNAIFDVLSNAIAYTVTITATATCADFTMGAPLAGKVTWAGTSALAISGSLNLSGGMAGITMSYTGIITLNATGLITITTNSVVLTCNLYMDGIGGTFRLVDDLNSSRNSNAAVIRLFNGTFDSITNSKGVIITGAGNTHISGDFTGASAFYNFTKISGATKTNQTSFDNNITVTHTFTITGDSAINRPLIYSSVIGTPRTITITGTTGNSFSNVDFKDITVVTGGADLDLSAITGLSGDCGGNDGITFTTSDTMYWYKASGAANNWSTAGNWYLATNGGGGAGRVPLPQDDVVLDANSFGAASMVLTQDMPRAGRSITFAGDGAGAVANTPTFTTSTTASIFGSLTLVAGMILTASTQTYTFEGRAANMPAGGWTLTMGGLAWAKAIQIWNYGGTYKLLDNFSNGTSTGASGRFNLAYGTFDANDFDITCGNFRPSTDFVELWMGNGLWTLGGAYAEASYIWQAGGQPAGAIHAEGSTLKITDPASTNILFDGGTQAYNNIWFSRGASTGSITISGSNTFNDFKDDGSEAHSLLFTGGTTQHFTSWSDLSGSLGKLITIASTNSTPVTFIKDGGGSIQVDYVNMQYITGSPDLTWYTGRYSLRSNTVLIYPYYKNVLTRDADGWARVSLSMLVPSGVYHLRTVFSTSGELMSFDDGQLEQSLDITAIEEGFIGDLILPKRAVRAEVGFADYNVPKFTGLANKFIPNIAKDTTQLYAYDMADRLKDIMVEDQYFENKRTDELIIELASIAGIGINQLTVETGTNTVEFAYFQEASVWTYMNQVAEAEGGRIFFDESGRLTFWNRQHYRDNMDIRYTFDFSSHITDLSYEISKNKVKNRIYIKGYPQKKLTDVKIYDDDSAPSISPGDTTEFFCQFNYNTEVSVPALNVQLPVIGTDIIANTQEDGGGSNISGSITISSYFVFRESMRINLHNANAATAYLTTFRIYGDPIVIARRIEELQEDTDSQAIYDVQELQIENNFITTDAFAETLAAQKLAELKDPRDFIKIEAVGVPYLQLGDIVRVQRSFAGEYENFHIVRNSWSFVDDFMQTMELEKKVII